MLGLSADAAGAACLRRLAASDDTGEDPDLLAVEGSGAEVSVLCPGGERDVDGDAALESEGEHAAIRRFLRHEADLREGVNVVAFPREAQVDEHVRHQALNGDGSL